MKREPDADLQEGKGTNKRPGSHGKCRELIDRAIGISAGKEAEAGLETTCPGLLVLQTHRTDTRRRTGSQGEQRKDSHKCSL